MIRNIGECRRHAPTEKRFPRTRETDYCGDHNPIEVYIKDVNHDGISMP